MSNLLTGGLAKTIGGAMQSIFLDATLTTVTATDGPNDWTPGEPVTVDHACKGIHDNWSSSLLAGGLVAVDDRKLLILADSLPVTPKAGDLITIRGEQFTIVPEGAGQPSVSTDPAKAVWICRARA